MPSLKQQFNTWHDWLQTFVPPTFRVGYLGRYVAVAHGFVMDVISQATSEALFSRNLRTGNFEHGPDDALVPIGNERLLPRYPNETNDGYRARLADAWNLWGNAGDETGIVDQLAAAGYPNAFVETPITASITSLSGTYLEEGISTWPDSSGYWSQFRVLIPFTVGQGSSAAITYGDEHYFGDGSVYGSSGDLVDFEDLATMRLIIQKFKPVDWVCREIVLLNMTGSTTSEEHHRAFPV